MWICSAAEVASHRRASWSKPLLLGGLGKGGVLGGSASLACNGGLQVLERGARFGGGIGDSIEVAGVLSGGKFGTKVHNVPLSIVLVNCFVNLILIENLSQ